MSDPPRPTAKRLRLCVPSQADYTVGDMKLWLKVHKDKDPAEYDIVGPKGRWKMGAGSEVLQDDHVCCVEPTQCEEAARAATAAVDDDAAREREATRDPLELERGVKPSAQSTFYSHHT